jgi:hypothetical protein
MPASDGAGVRMTRIIGTPQLDMLDPFLRTISAGSPVILIAASRP